MFTAGFFYCLYLFCGTKSNQLQNMNVVFKKLTLNELQELKQIGRSTYLESFSMENSDENMKSYLNTAFNSKKLSTELNEKQSEFYFVYYKNEVAGYLKLNFGTAQSEFKENDGMELERIYVLKKFQGKSIGKMALEHILKIAHSKKMKYVWLGVWDKNAKAIKFYKKHNFEVFSSHDFTMGNDIQTDFLMKLNLQ
tara:strand:+ start:89183 stop:89770 length:588 start_codon:yes stop_codon:yes gene_type:complete